MHNAGFWADYIRKNTIPEIEVLDNTFHHKILPAFQGIEEEAERVGDEKSNRLSKIAGEDADPADLAEAAHEAGLIHYETMLDIRQGTINLFTEATYHLFVQQLLFIHRKELLPKKEENNAKLFTLECVVEKLSEHEIKVKKFRAWDQLNELRLVANVVKHADGGSANKLKSLRPDMFIRPVMREFSEEINLPPGQVFQPLFGQDFYVTPEEFSNYLNAVKDFWVEFVEVLDA